ncbi:DUF3617 family protein [Parvibaculum sedimenti]|uniref:DUF3617 family protein n=1 Tax=Parvibaculum sedimenti TaxID=2608632 RepID=A0A6N6VNR8_9HYPH|nr:DUF3617 family protein [Parvibaculum sedimenti]KAB7742857.1 DUF3617 family protein [Parvibaculum sedimenti]
MKKVISIAVAALLLPVSAIAAPPQMAPGLWERTMTLGTNTFTDKECFSPDDVRQSAEEMLRPEGEDQTNCKTSGTWDGNVFHFKSECAMPEQGGSMTTIGTMTFESSSHMVQEAKTTTSMDGTSQIMTMKVDHKRIGDCPK